MQSHHTFLIGKRFLQRSDHSGGAEAQRAQSPRSPPAQRALIALQRRQKRAFEF
jgi:hypothetical protein